MFTISSTRITTDNPSADQWENRLNEIEDLLMNGGYDPKLYKERAELYLELGVDYSSEETIHQAIIDYYNKDINDPDAVLMLAHYYTEILYEFDLARELFNKYMKIRNTELDRQFIHNRAIVAKDIDEGKRFLESMGYHIQHPTTYFLILADYYLQRSNYEDAEKYINKALEIEPGDLYHILLLMEYYTRISDFSNLLKIYNQIKDVTPEEIENSSALQLSMYPHEFVNKIIVMLRRLLEEEGCM